MDASAGDAAAVLLHGDIILTIHQARCLPNMDLFHERLRLCFAACRAPCSSQLSDDEDIFELGWRYRETEQNKHQHHRPRIDTSDPYVKVTLAGATIARTAVIPNSENPIWDERFIVPVAHRADTLFLEVKDNDVFGAQTIGKAHVPTKRIAVGGLIHEWLPIYKPNGKLPKADASLLVSIQYIPVEETKECKQGIAGDPESRGVQGTYFPLHKGCAVTLYQDAHIRNSELPEISLEGGAAFQQQRCWEDICQAILEAHRLIYIVGWSVYHKVKLVREPTRPLPPDVRDLTLGELLKYKSQEGVRVCILVWDDKTSHDKLLIKTKGVMQTHDEETRRFFKNSSVICVLSPRYASNKLSIVKQQIVGTLFTHHQKCVLVDTQASGNLRKITAFIGGLDLCDGRYDTPTHRLFRDLDTVFSDDLHQPTFATENKGPRQPWHDLHCKIEGPAAYDILRNFEQRWAQATLWRKFSLRFKKATRWKDDALIKLERISWFLSPSTTVPDDDPSLWVSKEEDPEHWHVQVFRSIDSGSVKAFPKDVHKALGMSLVCRKNLVIDMSIHTGYVKAIRSAQHFIYIENQYFLGSSFGWPSYKNPSADNLIPMELALKIASKIRANQRFAVYVVIPMWPEGVPTSDVVQEILFWQGQTMKMMYEIIAQAIEEMQLENAHPEDYLNFYCLGNREMLPHHWLRDIPFLGKKPANLAQTFRRFMVYVHAKGMIVDDEYVIIGSANINQRSMAGSRDTEIAMGAYQPHHTWAERKGHPLGQVYGYRMSLWAEHICKIDGCFKEPDSLECVEYVNRIAEDNWSKYVADELKPLSGHLLKYPVKVEADGKVVPLPNHETFPDVGGRILGTQNFLPDTLTM